jgi:hypothetical protein
MTDIRCIEVQGIGWGQGIAGTIRCFGVAQAALIIIVGALLINYTCDEIK